jgi:glutamate/tyrosine decarboxylase-like PLP-dependent enzyme
MDELLRDAAERALAYQRTLPDRRVAPPPAAVTALDALAGPLPDGPTAPAAVLALLDEVGSPATVASAGGRYFGFVIGGALPVAVAANWLAAAWDQNAGLSVASPVAVRLEQIAAGWLRALLGLPGGCACGVVTGATMANVVGLAAARQAVLAAAGWDVGAQGLFGAPPVGVIVGEEVHVSVLKALTLLGFGRDRLIRVPVDRHGRMRAGALPPIAGPTIVCVQAGNVNTGAFDPFAAIGARARASGAWLHVDGAFGLWAAASPARAPLVAGLAMADSWSVDAHKWLNTPYDCGLAFVRDPASVRAAMATSAAAYLGDAGGGEPLHYVPEMSRRARGVELWAALRQLGRSGVADLVERTCRYAQRFAEGLSGAGYQVLNEVVLNQVLVSFGAADTTQRVIAALQEDGTCWCGGTVWQGQTAMRISVSSAATTEEDVERSLAAMLRIAGEHRR